MANLDSISIRFHTPYATDGKKEITEISVFVYDVGRNLVAQKKRFAGDKVFSEGTDSDGYDLTIINHIDKKDFAHGSFDVVIRPTGGDTWVMIPYMLIKYTDGSSTTLDGYDNRVVSELATKTTLVF